MVARKRPNSSPKGPAKKRKVVWEPLLTDYRAKLTYFGFTQAKKHISKEEALQEVALPVKPEESPNVEKIPLKNTPEPLARPTKEVAQPLLEKRGVPVTIAKYVENTQKLKAAEIREPKKTSLEKRGVPTTIADYVKNTRKFEAAEVREKNKWDNNREVVDLKKKKGET